MEQERTQVTDFTTFKYQDEIVVEKFGEAIMNIQAAIIDYSMPNVIKAYAAVSAFQTAVIWVKYFKEVEVKIKPTMKEIRIVLFGSEDITSRNMRAKYGVRMIKTTRGSVLEGALKIVEELQEILDILKTYAYGEGFFAKKPQDIRHMGTEGLDDSFQM